jgi:hypothetical protein
MYFQWKYGSDLKEEPLLNAIALVAQCDIISTEN